MVVSRPSHWAGVEHPQAGTAAMKPRVVAHLRAEMVARLTAVEHLQAETAVASHLLKEVGNSRLVALGAVAEAENSRLAALEAGVVTTLKAGAADPRVVLVVERLRG